MTPPFTAHRAVSFTSMNHRKAQLMTANSLQHASAGAAAPNHTVLALIVFVPCFFMLLAAGALARLLPGTMRGPRLRFARRGSLIHAARTAAYDCVAFALMG